MTKLFKKSIAVLLCFATFGAQAADTFSACMPPQVRVVFSNGILTPFSLGANSAKAVQQRAALLNKRARVDSDEIIYFYHEGNGAGDFAETFLQKEKEPSFSGISFAAKATTFFCVIAGLADGSALATSLLVVAQKVVPAAIMAEAQSRIDNAVSADVSMAKGFLQEGDSLLVVAHSQGNLYANETLRQLYASLPQAQVDSRVVIVSTANPAHGVVGKGGVASDNNYGTTTTDMVINGVRLAAIALGQLQPSLPNVTGVNSDQSILDFLTQHSFIGVYFNETLNSGKKTIQLMTDSLTYLANNASSTVETSSVAYTFKTTLTYDVSLAELFEGAPSLDVPQAGPYAGNFRSRVVSVSDKSMSFETDVLCSLMTALTATSSPLAVALVFPVEAGTPVATDVQLQTPSTSVRWNYPASALQFSRGTVQGENKVILSALTAMAQNQGESTGVLVMNPNADSK